MSTFSLRLAEDEYKALQAMALLTGQTMAALVRGAIDETVQRFAQADRHDLMQTDLERRLNAVALLRGRATVAASSALLTARTHPDRP